MNQLAFAFNPLSQINERYTADDIYTPQNIIDQARKCMGSIECDIASSKRANLRIKAKKIFTLQDSALSQSIHGYKTYWLNPPFSNIYPFISKFLAELDDAQGIVLLRYDSSTRYFKLLMESKYITAFCMPNHKLVFDRVYPVEKKTHIFEGCILFFRNIKPYKVSRYFSDIGYISYL